MCNMHLAGQKTLERRSNLDGGRGEKFDFVGVDFAVQETDDDASFSVSLSLGVEKSGDGGGVSQVVGGDFVILAAGRL